MDRNVAFVDGQNLHMGTTKADKPWRVDLSRFRVYLQQKYAVDQAYYFLGFTQDNRQDLYDSIQKAGFILHFREHSSVMLGKKKGNVDTDIVFLVMKMLYRRESFDKIVLVSGDGDYRMMVDFLIEEDRFKKILFPDQKRSSSLYKKIDLKYRADLSAEAVRRKVGHKRKGLLR
jgi:uncharacterized LabA/DUF88 family protein